MLPSGGGSWLPAPRGPGVDVGRSVLVPVFQLSCPEGQVDVRIVAGVLVLPPRTYLEQHGLYGRPVLQMVAVGGAGREARAVAGAQHLLALVGDQHHLA